MYEFDDKPNTSNARIAKSIQANMENQEKKMEYVDHTGIWVVSTRQGTQTKVSIHVTEAHAKQELSK